MCRITNTGTTFCMLMQGIQTKQVSVCFGLWL